MRILLQLAIQVAVVVSKIARVDYPRAWPDLFHTLLALLSESTSQLTGCREPRDPGDGGDLHGLRLGLSGCTALALRRCPAEAVLEECPHCQACVAGCSTCTPCPGRTVSCVPHPVRLVLEQSRIRSPPLTLIHAEQRVLLVLHHVLKELASKRLQSDQRAFEQVAALLLPPLAARWSADTAALLALLQPPGADPAPLFASWLPGLKCLRRLLAHGFPSDARTLACAAEVVAALPALLGALRALGALGQDEAQRGTLKLLKTLRQLQDVHPW